jgi:hypothetical protein
MPRGDDAIARARRLDDRQDLASLQLTARG